jgi:hypothetical protein
MIFFTEKCNVAGHKSELIEVDLSKAYGTRKPHYQVRCKGGGCCFGDYFVRKGDAIYSWNIHHLTNHTGEGEKR